MGLWEYVVSIHETGTMAELALFWGIVILVVLFLLLQLSLLRGRLMVKKALRDMGEFRDGLRGLREQIDEVERRIEKRLDSRAGELDQRMTKKLDQKGDMLQERIEQRASSLSDSIHKLESRASESNENVERFRRRIDEVESRIPNLFDKLDDFKQTLGKTFQAELGSVLNSFDNSLAALLQQMKSDLQLGLSRIEGIQNMVHSRERAERNLLGTPEEAAVGSALEEEEAEFAEWEQEAKELAGEPDESAGEREDDEGVEAELLEAIPVPDEDDEDVDEEDYPAEMDSSSVDEDEEED